MERLNPLMVRTERGCDPFTFTVVVFTYAGRRVDVDCAAVHRHTQLLVLKMHTVPAKHVPERREGTDGGRKYN